MALSQATLVSRVRRVLGETPYQQTATVADTTTLNITVIDSSKMSEGTILEWQDNGEQVVIKSITNATTVVVWARGAYDTTALAHSAVKVFIDPEVTYAEITDSLDGAINQLWPWAWKAVTLTSFAPSTTAIWYDVAATAVDLISVTQLYGSSSQYAARFGAKGSGLQVGFQAGLPAALVASGVGVRFPNGFAHASNTVSVVYRAKITNTVSGGNYSDLSDNQLAEAVVYSAAMEIVGNHEMSLVLNSDVSQGETPLGAGPRITGAQWLERKYRQALNNYYDELMRTIPPMTQWSP